MVPIVPLFSVMTPLDGSTSLAEIIQQHPLFLGEQMLHEDLIVLGFEGFHYILALDWMSQHGAFMDTINKSVNFWIRG